MRTFEKFHSKAITTIGSTFGSSIALHFALWIIHIFNSFNSKFQFFSVLFATLLHSWAQQIKLWDRDRKMEKNKQFSNFNFAYNFSVVKYASCIHDAWFCLSSSQTRNLSPTMIYYVKIVSQIESAPISSRNDSIGLNRLDLSVCFMLTEILRFYFSLH